MRAQSRMALKRRAAYRAAAAALGLALAAGATLAAGYRVDVEAVPRRLAAGTDPCAITVRITDALGAPVPDGTEVIFITTLGAIAPQNAVTSGGMARAQLTSDVSGTAEVSVLVAGQREVAHVEFRGGVAPETFRPPAEVRIDARYVAYSADYNCITATDRVRVRHGNLVIEAGDVQYEVWRGVLRARHAVAVSSGDAALEGDRLCYFIASGQGAIVRARDGVERIGFRAHDLAAPAPFSATDADFTPADTSATDTWIVARDALVLPNERIQFSDATIYVGDRRIVSMPHYVAPLGGQRGLLDQVFSFSSSGGVNLDVPIYYAADRAHAGSLRLRHRPRSSYGYGAAGWSLGVEEQYRLSPRSRGSLALQDLTESTRGFSLEHLLDLAAGSSVNMALNYYRYHPGYPGALTGRALYYKRLSGSTLNVVALGSKIGDSANWSVDANMRWGGREIGRSGVGYDLTANLGYGGGQLAYGGGLGVGGGVGLAPPEWRISRGTVAAFDLVQQYMWAQEGGQRSTFDARAQVRQRVGGLGAMTLAYTYNLSRGGYLGSYGREQLTINSFLSQARRWQASGYASYSLDRANLFASGGISYWLPFEQAEGRSPWRLDLRGNYTRFGDARNAASRIAIGRALGQYEVLLCYSPTANYGYGSYGYGYSSGKSLWIELAPLGL